MSDTFQIITPVDGSVYAERPLISDAKADAAVATAHAAQAQWQRIPLAERQQILAAAVDYFNEDKASIAEELAWTIGRPISQGGGEVGGFTERAQYMIEAAPAALADINPGEKAGFERCIQRVPVGVVFTIAPWNFPYMTAVNTIWPALLSGNAVILKQAKQTAVCSDRIARVLKKAGLPEGVFQAYDMSHATAARIMQAEPVRLVCFTGSVKGGQAVQRAIADGGNFAGSGLELGGKDPAYVRSDADLDVAAAGLADGALFNSGQSCCSIERIYVNRSVYEKFLETLCAEVKALKLGNPMALDTSLGPVVNTEAAAFIRGQIDDAVKMGARALIDVAEFPADAPGTPYLAPQVLVDVNHDMRVMTEESFGPVVGVMPVDSDEQAIELMNDSEFGLTASVWTKDIERARKIGEQLQTGTVYMNRCDYLDPALAWVGVKNTGRGCSLSVVGFEQLTRAKSFHFKKI